jgi:hypothetical protein
VLLVWVARPKPVARFGSSDPNSAASFGRTTQTSGTVWVERSKPAKRFGSNDQNFADSFGRATETLCQAE